MLKGIRVVVEAVDRVTAPMRAIGGSLRNINLAPLRNQLGRVVSAAKTAGAEIGRMARNVGIALAGMAAGAGAILARVARSSNDAAAGAERLGISMRAYQGLGYAARRSGADISEMEAAMKDLNGKVLDAVNGNKELRAGFRRMGVELRDANGNLRSTEDIFVDIASAFSRVPDGAKKSAAAMALMGNAGVKMIPLLNRGGDSLRDMMDEAERLGLIIDEKTAEGFKQLSEDMHRLQAVATGFQNTIASKLLPMFAPLLKSFTEWAIANREVIATRITDWIERIPGILGQAEQAGRAWLEALSPIGSAIAWIVEQLGPFHSGISGLSVLIGGKLLVTLWPLLRALSGLGLVIGKMALGPFVAMFAQLFTAVRAGMGVMAAFNLVLAANPIGAVILAVAALAAAAYLIYRNWDAVVPYFMGLWAAVKRVFNGVVEFVAGVFSGDFARAFSGIEEIAAGLLDYFTGFWSPIVDAFRTFLGWVDGQFGTGLLAAFDSVVAGIREAFAPLGAFLSERWADIRAIFEGFGDFLAGVFTGDLTRAFDGLKTIAAGLLGYFTGFWSPIVDAFRTFLGWVDGQFGTGLLAGFDSVVAGIREAFAPLGAFLSERWADIRAIFEGFGDFLAGVFTGDLTRAFDGLKTIAAGLLGYFTGFWSPVYDAFRSFLGWVDGQFGTGLLAGFDSVVAGIQGVVGDIAGLWSPVTAAFKAVEKWIKGTFAPMMKAAVQAVYDAIKPIIDTIAAAIEGISAGIDKVVGAASWAKDKVSSGFGTVTGGVSSAWNNLWGGGSTSPSAPDAPPVAPDVPSAFKGGVPSSQSVNLDGTVDVRVHYDRPPTVKAQMNDPRIGTDVTAGPSMVTP
ncbi:hypothetical protein [Mesorhizobium sp. KR1-2]|uniref:hypothetical protein n=1 Tax=Mesorhizobium sp. KR1-2 TaxID=3156609 RepID=UPI0032B3EDA3